MAINRAKKRLSGICNYNMDIRFYPDTVGMALRGFKQESHIQIIPFKGGPVTMWKLGQMRAGVEGGQLYAKAGLKCRLKACDFFN